MLSVNKALLIRCWQKHSFNTYFNSLPWLSMTWWRMDATMVMTYIYLPLYSNPNTRRGNIGVHSAHELRFCIFTVRFVVNCWKLLQPCWFYTHMLNLKAIINYRHKTSYFEGYHDTGYRKHALWKPKVSGVCLINNNSMIMFCRYHTETAIPRELTIITNMIPNQTLITFGSVHG